MHDATYTPPASLDALRQRSLIVGVVGLVAAAAGALINPGQFFHSYLLAYLLWLAAALGGLALTMLQHLSGGGWGVVLRRIFEAAARTLPWMALFFVPLAFGLRDLYPWTDTADGGPGPHPQGEGALPERALLPGPRGDLLRRLDRPGAPADALVRRAGPHRRRRDRDPPAQHERDRHRPLLRHDDLRRHRLGHVPRAALVLDDVRVPVHHRPGNHGAVDRDRHGPPAVGRGADVGRVQSPGTSTISGSCCSPSRWCGPTSRSRSS